MDTRPPTEAQVAYLTSLWMQLGTDPTGYTNFYAWTREKISREIQISLDELAERRREAA